MKKNTAKISLIILIGAIIYSCNSVKRVPDGKHLLTKNTVHMNGDVTKDETNTNLLYQVPNSSVLGYRLRLGLYNLAKKNPDSSYKAWLQKKPGRYKNLSAVLSEKQVERLGQSFIVSGLSNFLKKTGEAPVIVDEAKTKKSITRLNSHYYNAGYFNVKTTYKVDTLANKRATIKYDIRTGMPYMVDSISTRIATPALDSLYEKTKSESVLLSDVQYNKQNLDDERDRITSNFRNRGAYYFQQNYITYSVDTIDTGHKANIELIVSNQDIRVNDSTVKKPFKLFKISEVNIFTDNTSAKNTAKIVDSVTYNDFNLYSSGTLNYRPKAITDAVFITKGTMFSDFRKTLSLRYLNNLKVFNYPSIQYVEDPADSTGTSLITNIFLTPMKKYTFNVTGDITHSNIQDFGITASPTLTIRNIFRGAETLDISTRGNIGSSRDLANPNGVFFNISEYGADIKLNFPRIFLPFNTERIIPKNMIPSTIMSFGFSKQQNIGLDKENFTGIVNYNWSPKRFVTSRFDLLNVQYVRNVNPGNYFNVYSSSYDRLNNLARAIGYIPSDQELDHQTGTAAFIRDVQDGNTPILINSEDYKTVSSIEERRKRLTENNLIFASNFSYSKTTKRDLYDNDFYIFKAKVESAGNALSLLSNLTKEPKNEDGKKSLFNVEYSQYIKTEFEFIKHWDFGKTQILAVRAFGGIAIPYGNSNNIPFSRSYFAGGSNDNRGWQSYSLGPGSSGGVNDFNEANMKLTGSAEFRINLLGKFYGAVFVDAGNIWNTLDNVTDKKYTFEGIKDLQEIAVGSGFGIRYDLNFFVIRLDLGYKTYNPASEEGQRWFRGYNFSKTVLNIGINYPF
ncbi:BamA/TamA family outer membrane protein [Flavobacterium kingsejongi]|uniref:Bacterial surface antigen (D15) domain-containing protein n=1 Tax=Flavobacterium kingsejongi TaxID=1678728 RepID=A0A2S1LN71_9FLAO|nr:BamA/TamA family outer membrane protein [Flavobacterium kingsejongi]AWG25138.1 hypothetical protein FK004_07775 [Flavobacterium kingsejongi]